jgi:hypothetical protein
VAVVFVRRVEPPPLQSHRSRLLFLIVMDFRVRFLAVRMNSRGVRDYRHFELLPQEWGRALYLSGKRI